MPRVLPGLLAIAAAASALVAAGPPPTTAAPPATSAPAAAGPPPTSAVPPASSAPAAAGPPATSAGPPGVVGLPTTSAGAPARAGGRAGSRIDRSAGSQGAKATLDASPDPNSPHELWGFEPRNASEGDIWTFGRAHAAAHHVLAAAPGGDAAAVAGMLDAFAAQHGLGFGLAAESARVLDSVARRAAEHADAAAAKARGVGGVARGVNVLVLDAGLGGRALRCLPALLGSAPALRGASSAVGADEDAPVHELVSIESDAQLSGLSARLVAHALGFGDGSEAATPGVRHLPLMPGEDTSLDETLMSLRDDWEIPSFDLVLLGDGPGGRSYQQQQLEALLKADILRPGAMVHAEGAAAGDEATQRYLDAVKNGGRDFDSEVHDLGNGNAAVVSTLRHADDEL